MMIFLWLLSGATFYITCKWFLEREPDRRIWTGFDVILFLSATVAGPIGIVMFVVVLAVLWIAERSDKELFRFGKKGD